MINYQPDFLRSLVGLPLPQSPWLPPSATSLKQGRFLIHYPSDYEILKSPPRQ